MPAAVVLLRSRRLRFEAEDRCLQGASSSGFDGRDTDLFQCRSGWPHYRGRVQREDVDPMTPIRSSGFDDPDTDVSEVDQGGLITKAEFNSRMLSS